MAAAMHRQHSAVQLLIQQGADPFERGEDSASACDVAQVRSFGRAPGCVPAQHATAPRCTLFGHLQQNAGIVFEAAQVHFPGHCQAVCPHRLRDVPLVRHSTVVPLAKRRAVCLHGLHHGRGLPPGQCQAQVTAWLRSEGLRQWYACNVHCGPSWLVCGNLGCQSDLTGGSPL